MVDGGPNNTKKVQSSDRCNWCNKPVGSAGAGGSVPGFPYCADCQNGGWKKKK